MNEPMVPNKETTEGMANAVYILYLAGLVFWITGIVGVVIAYVNEGDAPDWLKSHYRFQIRTFWIGALYMFLGAISIFFVIGYFVFLFFYIWLIVRCIKGMKSLGRKEAHPNPTGWMF